MLRKTTNRNTMPATVVIDKLHVTYATSVQTFREPCKGLIHCHPLKNSKHQWTVHSIHSLLDNSLCQVMFKSTLPNNFAAQSVAFRNRGVQGHNGRLKRQTVDGKMRGELTNE